MSLKRWDNGVCITYGKTQPAIKVGIPAAPVTAYIAGSSFRAGIDTALDEAVKKGRAPRQWGPAGRPPGFA
jgi:hypothetical protein